MNRPAPDLAANKQAARVEAKDRLGGLGPIRDEVSAKVIENLIESDQWARASTVMAYLAMPSEVCLDALWEIKPGLTMAAPRVNWKTGQMHPALLHKLDNRSIEIRARGVREPAPDRPAIDPGSIDIVLVPGLAFDTEGGRLGRGGGCYDRFLPRATGAIHVGVCWSGQIVTRVPVGETDARVHMLLTEQGLQQCQGPGG